MIMKFYDDNEDKLKKTKIRAKELKNVKVDFVSLVDRGANGKKFVLFKRHNPDIELQNDHDLLTDKENNVGWWSKILNKFRNAIFSEDVKDSELEELSGLVGTVKNSKNLITDVAEQLGLVDSAELETLKNLGEKIDSGLQFKEINIIQGDYTMNKILKQLESLTTKITKLENDNVQEEEFEFNEDKDVDAAKKESEKEEKEDKLEPEKDTKQTLKVKIDNTGMNEKFAKDKTYAKGYKDGFVKGYKNGFGNPKGKKTATKSDSIKEEDLELRNEQLEKVLALVEKLSERIDSMEKGVLQQDGNKEEKVEKETKQEEQEIAAVETIKELEKRLLSIEKRRQTRNSVDDMIELEKQAKDATIESTDFEGVF